MSAILSEPDFSTETVPGLLVSELMPRLTGQDDRTFRLMQRAAEAEERARQAEARARQLADVLHQTQLLASSLSEQVRMLKGEGAQAQAGCHIVPVPVDCGYVLVEYELEDGEPETHEHPGDPGAIVPLHVFVGGKWIGVDDLRSALDHDALVESIEGATAC